VEVRMQKNTQVLQVVVPPGRGPDVLLSSPVIQAAAKVLQQGGLVAFPTETVYGLGANGLDSEAVAGIFAAKGRPADNPLILHIAAMETLEQIVPEVPPLARRLAQSFWPGPLTLVLPKGPAVPAVTTGGLDTVAVRMPDHPIALALLAAAGVPVAAPSANISGRPSPTEAAHVTADLQGRIDIILDGGPTPVGVESTVLDCTGTIPVILRPGGVSKEALEDVVGTVELDSHVQEGEAVTDGPARSPGMKYKHYAPKAPAVLVRGEPPGLFMRITELAQELDAQGEMVGLMASRELLDYWRGQGIDQSKWQVMSMGSRTNPGELAANIYRCLRELDETNVTQIILEGVPAAGVGLAVMNRLQKAAAYRVVDA
jgi:L-threonylcarbamoyladenylate synthase